MWIWAVVIVVVVTVALLATWMDRWTSPTSGRRRLAAALAGLLLGGLSAGGGAGAASAARLHDPDLTAQALAARASLHHACGLARVGTQFVRCDNLTGNAVHAPRWVPEQRP